VAVPVASGGRAENLPEVPDASTYEGREAIARYFETALRDAWDEWRFVPRELIDGPSGAFVAVDNSARSRAGVELQMDLFQVARVSEGMIVYAAGYLDRRQALEDAGLADKPETGLEPVTPCLQDRRSTN
jgi:ketosteroid isomerase-like protein